MQNEPSLKERFFAETPVFFKKVQGICLILMTIVGALTAFGQYESQLMAINAVLFAVHLVCLFAVQDIEKLKNSPDPTKTAVELLTDLAEQKEAIVKTLRPIFHKIPEPQTDEFPETPVDRPQAA